MISMDRLCLNEREITYYFNLFGICDTAKQGQVPFSVAATLLSQSGLSQKSLDKIFDLCGAKRIGYFGRNEFFLALKLIALAQTGNDLSLNSLKNFGRKLPLPSFEQLPNHFLDACKDEIHALVMSTAHDTKAPGGEKQSLADTVLQPDEASLSLDQRHADKLPHEEWVKFEADDTGLLTNERVERLSRYACTTKDSHPKADSRGQLQSIRRSDSVEGNRPLMSSSDSTDSEGCSVAPLHSRTATQSGVQANSVTPQWSSLTDGFKHTEFHISNPVTKHTGLLAQDEHASMESSGLLKRTGLVDATVNHSGLDVQTNQEPSLRSQSDLSLNLDNVTEYVGLFGSICPDQSIKGNIRVVAPSDVKKLFTSRFSITAEDFDEIWRAADLNQDDLLNETEFCIASHLVYLLSVKGIPVSEAAPATSSFMSNVCAPSAKSQLPHLPNQRTCPPHPSEYSKYVQLCPLSSTTLRNSADEPLSEPEGVEAALLPDLIISPSKSKDSIDGNVSSPSESCSASLASTHPPESSSLSLLSSSDSSNSSLDDDTDSHSSQEHPDIERPSKVNANSRRSRHRRADSVKLLAALTGRSLSKVKQYSSGRRRRLLIALIHEAKAANHVILRLNNEMHGEWTELKDQRINLSIQLQHLGLQPPT